MDFWDTVLGNTLAHVLIDTLPELTEKLSKKEQYGTTASPEDVADYIDKRIHAGERYIASFQNGKGKVYVIMESDNGRKKYE